MARLPQPGGDNGNWGDILNDYLSQVHKPDGMLKDSTVTANVLAPNSITNAAIASDAVNAASIADGSITEALLANDVQTKLNSSAPTWNTISGKPSVVGAGVDRAAARAAIDAASNRDRVFYIDDFGADPTGLLPSDDAMAAALVELGTQPGVLVFGVGTYLLASNSGYRFYARQSSVGHGASTLINYSGNGTCFTFMTEDFLTKFYANDTVALIGGVLGGFILDGSSAGPAAIGINYGNLVHGVIREDTKIQHFTGASAIGIRFFNRDGGWTERMDCSVEVTNCTTDVKFDGNNTAVAGSFMYSSWRFKVGARVNQNAVVIDNYAHLINCKEFSIMGNMQSSANGATPNSGVALTITNNSVVDGTQVRILLECNGVSGAVSHRTMLIDTTSAFRANGSVRFVGANGAIWVPMTTVTLGMIAFFGPFEGDTTYGHTAFWQSAQIKGSLTQKGELIGGNTAYVARSNVFGWQLVSGAQTLSFADLTSMAGVGVTFDLIVVQPSSGAAGTVTWPSGVTWPNGLPILTATNGARDVIRFVGRSLTGTNDGNGLAGVQLTRRSMETLSTPRLINGVSFDGSTNIVTPQAIPVATAPSGHYLVPSNTGSTATIAMATAGTAYFAPLFVRSTQIFTGLSTHMSTQGIGATNPLVLMALYADTSGKPGGNPLSGSTVNFNPMTQATGNVDGAFSSPIELAAGWYWACWAITFTGTFSTAPVFTSLAPQGNNVLTTLANNSHRGWSVSGVTGSTLPNNPSVVPGSGQVPIMGLKAA